MEHAFEKCLNVFRRTHLGKASAGQGPKLSQTAEAHTYCMYGGPHKCEGLALPESGGFGCHAASNVHKLIDVHLASPYVRREEVMR